MTGITHLICAANFIYGVLSEGLREKYNSRTEFFVQKQYAQGLRCGFGFFHK